MPEARARDGCPIHYEVAGEDDGRPRVVYLPSWGSDLRKVPSLAHSPLAHRCRVLLFDVRGTGRSGKPEPGWASPPSMEILADDVADLLDALGWHRAHILGCSFGAQLALVFAAHRPERCESLVLVNSHAGGDVVSRGAGQPAFVETLEELSVSERVQKMVALADLRRDACWFGSAQGAAILKFAVVQEEELAYGRSSPPAGAPFVPGYAEGRRWLLLARRGYDWRHALGPIGAALIGRVLVIGSRHDGLVPRGGVESLHAKLAAGAAAAAAEQSGAAAAGVQLAWMEAGHWPSVTADQNFWPRVVGFIAERHTR